MANLIKIEFINNIICGKNYNKKFNQDLITKKDRLNAVAVISLEVRIY